MRAFSAVALSVVVIGCGGPVKRPDGGIGLLPIGARAPDMEGRDAGAHDVKLSELRGKLVLVYFYGADGKAADTAQATGFRDAWKQYEAANVAILGVSPDTAESHRNFEHDNALQFPLVADESGSVAASYGVRKSILGYERVSFLVDREGRILRVWSEVDPNTHANEVLAETKRLR